LSCGGGGGGRLQKLSGPGALTGKEWYRRDGSAEKTEPDAVESDIDKRRTETQRKRKGKMKGEGGLLRLRKGKMGGEATFPTEIQPRRGIL